MRYDTALETMVIPRLAKASQEGLPDSRCERMSSLSYA